MFSNCWVIDSLILKMRADLYSIWYAGVRPYPYIRLSSTIMLNMLLFVCAYTLPWWICHPSLVLGIVGLIKLSSSGLMSVCLGWSPQILPWSASAVVLLLLLSCRSLQTSLVWLVGYIVLVFNDWSSGLSLLHL